MRKDRIILGIDPGTTVMGYGLIHQKGDKIELIALGVVKLNKLSTPSQKLKKIFQKTLAIIDEYKPNELAIEAQFFGKNVQSMLKLGRAQGVAIAAALHREMDYTEYEPKKIKKAITGNGNASKEQVAAMLKSIIGLKKVPDLLDATDGLATAVCHAYQRNPIGDKKSYGSWGAFISDNPGRVKK
ncbi:MAG: crossover junction endodeoxyribonuclease RuvC [Bacteroidetes bacterium]|nr:MAG: crossover junction endodeoxyribonuclease RuvC [Bacteroidota bacterium]